MKVSISIAPGSFLLAKSNKASETAIGKAVPIITRLLTRSGFVDAASRAINEPMLCPTTENL